MSCLVNLSVLLLNFVQILDLSKLLDGFVKLVLWILVIACFSRLLPNETKLKFDQHFKLVGSLKKPNIG